VSLGVVRGDAVACHTPETVTFAVGLLVWLVKKKLREIDERNLF